MEDTDGYRKATFAAGCFWDVEAAFRIVDGVVETVAGYTGGFLSDPTYEQVDTGTTGHVQAVGIVFDPAVISYDTLLDVFFRIHDPFEVGSQGDFTGLQYRSVIFVHDAEQTASAERVRERIAAGRLHDDRHIQTEILPAGPFWPAEEHHQQFYEKCASSYCTSRQSDDG